MKEASRKIPSRTLNPVKIEYCILTKSKFVALVGGLRNIMDSDYGHGHMLAIEIEGFDGPFRDAQLFVETLNNDEWRNLEGITVVVSKPNSHPTARLRVGMPATGPLGVGLRAEILLGTTNQRTATRENIRRFLMDYRRPVGLTSATTSLLVMAVGFVVAGTLVLRHIGSHFMILRILTVELMVLFAVFVGIAAGAIHVAVVPRLELVVSESRSRWSHVKKTVLFLIAVMTSIGTAITIWNVMHI